MDIEQTCNFYVFIPTTAIMKRCFPEGFGRPRSQRHLVRESKLCMGRVVLRPRKALGSAEPVYCFNGHQLLMLPLGGGSGKMILGGQIIKHPVYERSSHFLIAAGFLLMNVFLDKICILFLMNYYCIDCLQPL